MSFTICEHILACLYPSRCMLLWMNETNYKNVMRNTFLKYIVNYLLE